MQSGYDENVLVPSKGRHQMPAGAQNVTKEARKGKRGNAVASQHNAKRILTDKTNVNVAVPGQKVSKIGTSTNQPTVAARTRITRSSHQAIAQEAAANMVAQVQPPDAVVSEEHLPTLPRCNAVASVRFDPLHATNQHSIVHKSPVPFSPMSIDTSASTRRASPLTNGFSFIEDEQMTTPSKPVTFFPLSTASACSLKPKNIDAQYDSVPSFCTTYATDIYEFLLQKEEFYKPDSQNYLQTMQTDVNSSMREILLDWLIDVGGAFNFSGETLFLTKNYIDRFLALRRVTRDEAQLVGITCMFIASKFEEMTPPSVIDFVSISADTYTKQQILDFEELVLNALRFNLSAPTEDNFLRRFLLAAVADIPSGLEKRLRCITSYLTERTMQDYTFVKYRPSVVASAAIYLALCELGQKPWTPTLMHYTGYLQDNATFRNCIVAMHRMHETDYNNHTERLRAVRSKYEDEAYQNVASIRPKLLQL